MLFSWLERYARHRRRISLSFLAGVSLLPWPASLHAQGIGSYFQSGIPGFDQQLGVTVQSRLRPLYSTPGIDIDGFNVRPRLDQSVLYNTNPAGTSGPGSWVSHTSAGVSANSLWTRNSLGITAGVDNFEYFSLPTLDHTNWNIGVGGGYTIGDSQLALIYSHQTSYQIGTSIGTVQSETPLQIQTDTVDLNYAFDFGRFTVTPDVSASSNRFGTATVLGVSLNQNYLDRNALSGGVTTRFSLSEEGGLLLVMRGTDNKFPNPLAGTPTNDSENFMLLGGLDYQAEGVWRYRLLAGVELSTFAAAQYSSDTSPVVQGSVIWTPTGVLTVTGTLSRSVQAPQSGGTNGFILTSANVVGDYELKRNILLQGRGGFQYVQYLQAGTQTNFTFGASVSWLLNRKMRLSFDYDRTEQSGISGFSTPSNLNTLTTGSYNQSIVGLTLHLAL